MGGLPTLGGSQLWADRRWRGGWRIQQHVLTGHCRLLDPQDRRRLSGPFELCVEVLADVSAPACPDCVVVVLHGLGRSRRSMRALSEELARAGHVPVLLDYPSTRRGLDAHVEQVLEVLANLEGARRVSFVTHSLGGIVARGALSHPAWPTRLLAERVVMLAPPNRGAAFARVLAAHAKPLLSAVMGPSGNEVAAQVPYPPPPVPCLVVAGSRRGGRGLNPAIAGDDDGIVGVAETRLDGMAEHLVVDCLHTFVMNHPEARAATLRFLSGSARPKR